MRHSNNSAEHHARRRQIQSAMAIIAAQGQALRALDVDKTDLQPVTGTVLFTSGGGGLIAETSRTLFQDQVGEATASGVTQNRARGNYFGGSIPTGQMWMLWSLGLSAVGGPTITGDNLLAFAEACSVRVNLRTRDNAVEIGGVLDWPDVLGSNGSIYTGNGEIGRRTFTYPIVLEPLDSFTIEIVRRRPVTVAVNEQISVHAYMRATRIYDERVLALS